MNDDISYAHTALARCHSILTCYTLTTATFYLYRHSTYRSRGDNGDM